MQLDSLEKIRIIDHSILDVLVIYTYPPYVLVDHHWPSNYHPVSDRLPDVSGRHVRMGSWLAEREQPRPTCQTGVVAGKGDVQQTMIKCWKMLKDKLENGELQ